MKRWTWIVFATVLASGAIAQAPFTIVRPVDGSKVRETVRVQIPKNSIPEGSYVGIFLNGKFLEARTLDVKGNFFEYALDTKARKLPDGKQKLELVLYAEAGDRPRIVDRTSVEIEIQNVASIKIPEDGFKLRYKFPIGTKYSYQLDVRQGMSTISEVQARMGGRAAELPLDAEKARMQYSVENNYSNGDGLVRFHLLPDKGRSTAFLRTNLDPSGRNYEQHEMHPLYMRITNTGLEKFGSVPLYIPMSGSLGEAARTDLYAVIPLPSLPDKNVKPGDFWMSRFQDGQLDLGKLRETTSLVSKTPARGDFLGVEWEMGHPCAKLRYSLELNAGRGGAPAQQNSGTDLGQNRLRVEQTLWFALDKGIVIKVVSDQIQDIRTTAPASGGAAGGRGGNDDGGGRGTAQTGPGLLLNNGDVTPPKGLNQLAGSSGAGGGGQSAGGAPGGPGFGPGGQRGGGQPPRPVVRFVRLRTQMSMVLEK